MAVDLYVVTTCEHNATGCSKRHEIIEQKQLIVNLKIQDSRFKIQDSFIVSRCQDEKKRFVTLKRGYCWVTIGRSFSRKDYSTLLCCRGLAPLGEWGGHCKLFKVVVSDNLHPVMNDEMFPSWWEWCPPGGEWPTIHTARGLTGWFDEYGDSVNYTITISQPSMTPGRFLAKVFDHSLHHHHQTLHEGYSIGRRLFIPSLETQDS